MKIQTQDFYHGAALTQIAEHESFKALNKGSSNYGHYLVNADCHLFVRYSTGDGPTWSYTFTSEQLKAVNNVAAANASAFVALVCGEETVCLLDQVQLETVIDLGSTNAQWVKVEAPPSKSCRVSGSAGQLKKVIPHNAFPKALFE